MLRSLYLTPDGQRRMDLPVIDIAFALQEVNGLLWVDFEDTPSEEDEPILSKTFGFHPLAIDDALQETHVPKVDDWGQYLYIVLHSVVFDQEGQRDITTNEVDIFLGKNYLVTHHDQKIDAIDRVFSTIQRDERHLKSGPDHLLYRIADEIVTSYMPVVEKLDEEIDKTEDETFDRPNPEVLQRIFTLKRAVSHLQRILGPQREVFNKLGRDDYPVVDTHEKVYFRDVYDHLVRLYDISESIRDLASGALDTYLSVVNNRMNDIMKTLTLITTLFMPISFVVGFFGMNFFMPVAPLGAWTSGRAFLLTMLILLLLPTGMYTWARRRKWM